ncbi:MAG: hypothetical protein ACRCZK_01860 [Oscillospiraceae bacterium]
MDAKTFDQYDNEQIALTENAQTISLEEFINFSLDYAVDDLDDVVSILKSYSNTQLDNIAEKIKKIIKEIENL